MTTFKLLAVDFIKAVKLLCERVEIFCRDIKLLLRFTRAHTQRKEESGNGHYYNQIWMSAPHLNKKYRLKTLRVLKGSKHNSDVDGNSEVKLQRMRSDR